MAERLTDQTQMTTKPSSSDVLYLVDVSDATDNAAGSSKKIQVQNLLKGFTFRQLLGCLVYQVAVNPSNSQIEIGDYIIYMNEAEDRLVVGLAKGNITTVPTDLDDSSKFLKFIDGSSLLP